MRAQHWVATAYNGLEGLRLVEYDVPEPQQGEVVIEVRAAGVNPADWKYVTERFNPNPDPALLPIPRGFEVSGVIAAIGPHTEIATGGGAVGDEVIAFGVNGGYATALTVPAADVFAKPANLSFPEAAGLMLSAATALDMLRITGAKAGDTVLVHGASGAVGVALLQLLRDLGARAIGTASERSFDVVRRFGGEPVTYGDGLADRVRALAPDGIDVALDCVGTDEAIDVSVELLKEHDGGTDRFVTIANSRRARQDGLTFAAGATPGSREYRDEVRADIVAKAAAGRLEVPLGPSYPLDQAVEALRLIQTGHPGGKVTLIP